MAVRWNFSNIPGDAVSVVSATGTSMRLHKFNIIGDSKNALDEWLFHSPDNMTWSIQHVSGLFLDVDSKDVGLHADQTEAKIWQIESALTGNINTTYFMIGPPVKSTKDLPQKVITLNEDNNPQLSNMDFDAGGVPSESQLWTFGFKLNI